MDDIFKDQAKWLNAWQEQQQKLVQQYAKWGEEFTKDFTGAAKQQAPANLEDIFKAQQELFEQFSHFSTELQNNIQQVWSDKLPKELLQHFNFSILQEFYKNWVSSMKFPGGLQNPFMDGQNWVDPSSLLNSFMNQEHPFSWVFSNNYLTKDLQQLFGLLQGSKLPGSDLYSQLFTTYQGFFNQLANSGARQNFDKLLETFAGWKEQADKYLLAPQVGIHRETAQDFSKAISLSLDYIQALANMAKLMEETARKGGNRFQAKLVERSLNYEPPIKFNEFCSLWTMENEAVFLEVFGSKEFATTQKEFVSAQMRLKIQLNKLAEKALEQTPIALKSDIDLAAKEILELKRNLRRSKKQQQQLKDDAITAQKAFSAAEKRIQELETVIEKVQKLEMAVKKVETLESTMEKVQAQAGEAEKKAKSAMEQATKPAAKAATKPAAKAATKPAAKAATKPAAKAASKPAAKAASKPAAKAASKPVAKTASKPAAKTASKKPAAAKKPAGTPTE